MRINTSALPVIISSVPAYSVVIVVEISILKHGRSAQSLKSTAVISFLFFTLPMFSQKSAVKARDIYIFNSVWH